LHSRPGQNQADQPLPLSQSVDGSRVTIPLLPIVVTFSEPVDRASFIAPFRVPGSGGTISSTRLGPLRAFTPLSAGSGRNTTYPFGRGEDLSGTGFRSLFDSVSLQGLKMSVRRCWQFDQQSMAHSRAGLTPEDPTTKPPGDAGFETTWGIELQFSEPVSREKHRVIHRSPCRLELQIDRQERRGIVSSLRPGSVGLGIDVHPHDSDVRP